MCMCVGRRLLRSYLLIDSLSFILLAFSCSKTENNKNAVENTLGKRTRKRIFKSTRDIKVDGRSLFFPGIIVEKCTPVEKSAPTTVGADVALFLLLFLACFTRVLGFSSSKTHLNFFAPQFIPRQFELSFSSLFPRLPLDSLLV